MTRKLEQLTWPCVISTSRFKDTSNIRWKISETKQALFKVENTSLQMEMNTGKHDATDYVEDNQMLHYPVLFPNNFSS